nr:MULTISPECIES: catalase [unclassified Brevibacterium]
MPPARDRARSSPAPLCEPRTEPGPEPGLGRPTFLARARAPVILGRVRDLFASDVPSASVLSGPAGPILLQDHYLIERLSRPTPRRRSVNAKGGGALGTFTVTGDVSALTRAQVFAPGARTQVLARFSSTFGEPGSPDTWRDLRGFAVKFYGPDGNLDIVGNNSPVYYVRDTTAVGALMRAGLRDPETGLYSHDAQWDFWSATPQTAHQVAYLMGDRGIPRSWREQNGYGTHTFQWVAADGRKSWVKYHFESAQKADFLSAHGHEGFGQADAQAMAGIDADFHRRDLAQAINAGNYPCWTLSVQVMDEQRATEVDFDPFDPTRVWPHSEFPLHEVGRLELDRNPRDFFTQVEQAAFTPANQVAGTGLSPDPILLARVRAYGLSHRQRIGADFAALPVNRTLPGVVPGTAEPLAAEDLLVGAQSAGSPAAGRAAADFAQAHTLVRTVMDDEQRDRLVGNVSGHLLCGVSEPVLSRSFDYLRRIDAETGDRVEAVVRAAGHR